MKIFGCGIVKKIGELVQGELCAFAQSNDPALGICVGKNGRFSEIGFLTGGPVAGSIRNIEPHVTCYSYGSYWVLDMASNSTSAPMWMKNKPNPRLVIDAVGPKLVFTSGSHTGSTFFHLESLEVSEIWPDMAVQIESFIIWQNETVMNLPNAKPMFIKEAPAASD